MSKVVDYEDIQLAVEELLSENESDELEFKSASGGFPGSFWETYSSFANTNGGSIILGVKEKEGTFLLEGLSTQQVQKYRKDFFKNVHNRQKVSIPLVNDKDVRDVVINGSNVLVFFIPRADRNLRPVYCGLDPYTGTYRRNDDGDFHCTREEVRSMFTDADLENPVDGKILKGFTIKDLDMTSVHQYRRLFEMSNPSHVWNTLQDKEFLEKLNVIRTERLTDKKGVTLAGILMFGTYSAITDADPNFFPDYKEIIDSKSRWINRICPDGNWESNLFQFYQKTLPVLQSFLPKPFKLENNIRINETPAHISIREALTNFCVHADYTENATLTIYKYSDKIVFSNPGTMLITKQQYYKGGESVCRNKYLQTMFSFLGSAEKAGSGSDKIIHGWQELNWKKPYIEQTFRPDKVVLTMPLESLIDDNIKQGLIKLYGNKLNNIDHNQQMTLALAYSEDEISNERLQYTLNMHRSDISKMLKDMCDNKLLSPAGYGRGRRYSVYCYNQAKGELPRTKGELPKVKDGCAKQRYTKEEIKTLILDYCEEWRTAEEISNYIERSRNYIRNKVIPLLDDRLEKLYPTIPHHPKQKYRRKASR